VTGRIRDIFGSYNFVLYPMALLASDRGHGCGSCDAQTRTLLRRSSSEL